MTPIEFVVHNGGSSRNMPAHELAEAMSKDVVVRGPGGECEVLSYYFSNGVMNLDVQYKDDFPVP